MVELTDHELGIADGYLKKLNGDIEWIKTALNDFSRRLTSIESGVGSMREGCHQRHQGVDSAIHAQRKEIVDKLEAAGGVQNDRLRSVEQDITATKAKQTVIIAIVAIAIAALGWVSTVAWFRGSTINQIEEQIQKLERQKSMPPPSIGTGTQ